MRLEAQHISRRFGNDNWLFRRANASFHTGEIVGLLGPSGCGKSTFCKTIAGFERPQEGKVLLNGQELPSKGYRPVQLIYQHPEKAVNPRWKVEKTLTEGWTPDNELLEALQIDPSWLNRSPSELSGGELQRICIARALAPQTTFLIADEMTTMLDAITQAKIWNTLLTIAEQRKMGLIVVSHDKHLVHRICTRVIQFQDLSVHSISEQ